MLMIFKGIKSRMACKQKLCPFSGLSVCDKGPSDAAIHIYFYHMMSHLGVIITSCNKIWFTDLVMLHIDIHFNVA